MTVRRPCSVGHLRLIGSALATVQVVWFYLARVRSAFSLDLYETGQAPLPFQQRLAMQPVLRWAHNSPALTHAAHWLTQQHAWFPGGVRPEAFVELPIDIVAVVVTACLAERIYARASQAQLLRGWVYPLTLATVAIVFDLCTVHSLRFVYDLPSMAVFATGLYLLYTRRPLWQFALLFACGTLNRETTLLLLPALLLQRWSAARAVLAATLLSLWLGWHEWVTHMFAANPSAAGPRLLLNLAVLLCPLAWPQLGSILVLCCVSFFYGCADHTDPVLRRWRILVPLWLCFMLHYGLLIETRVFGELIVYLVPVAALMVEREILGRVRQTQCVMTRSEDAVMVS